MHLRLSPANRRATALALAALSLAGVYSLTLHVWFTQPLMDIADEMQTLRLNQQRYAALSNQRPALEATLAQLRHSTAGSEDLLADADLGAATAQLLQVIAADLQKVSTTGGCTVTNRIPVAVNQSEPYRQVSVRISLECAIEPLAGLLYQVENSKTSMFIESLKIEKSRTRASSVNRLSAQLLISAYLQNPALKETPP